MLEFGFDKESTFAFLTAERAQQAHGVEDMLIRRHSGRTRQTNPLTLKTNLALLGECSSSSRPSLVGGPSLKKWRLESLFRSEPPLYEAARFVFEACCPRGKVALAPSVETA